MNILTKTTYAALFCALSACHVNLNVTKSNSSQVTDNLAIEFVNAYNAHDPEAMLDLVHQEIKYMFIDGNQIHTETNGKEALAEFLEPYFKENPAARSEIISSEKMAVFIHQVERAIWTNKQGHVQSQCSLSVYELKNELIINVWYFPAFQCEGE